MKRDDEGKKDVWKNPHGSTTMLAPKIAGAMTAGFWLAYMQNASIIRYPAEYLLTQISGKKAFADTDEEYVQMLRTAMLEFRELFKKWVKEFNRCDPDEFDDDWGLIERK